MLKSADNSKPSRKLENEERNLDAKAPRSRVKLDPTDPPSGTRSTYFTGMSSASYQSLKARDQKQRVENYMTIRATRVSISDYVLARDEEVDFTISNFSKKIQYLNLQSPKTKHFYLTKQVLIKDYVLAPGMEVVIKLTFKAPLVGEPHVECRDFIVVDVKGGDSIVVDLEALPSIPRLEISKEVDLGKNLLDLELVRALMPLNGKISSSKDAVVKGWIKSKIKISNLGKVTTDYKFLFDEGFPIRITPMTGAVKGNSSCECVVEFLPVIVGEFNYVCKFAYGDKNLEFSVRGTVIETLVQLVTLDGKDVSQLKFLDFKNTYFGHKMKIPLLIKNGNSNDCSWMISSAGRGEVNVIQRNNVEGSQFSSSPSKGSVAPGESTFVDIEFDPKRIALKKGFTALGTQTEQVHHKVKMKFDYDDGFQKQSYTFDVVGSASPFQVKLSSSEIVFPAINTKGSISKKICLINSNPNLGARFEFDKVAHFDISPLKGVILPSQKVEIKISFVPNQYGNFSIQSTCKFYWNHSKDVLKSGPQSTVKAICHSVLSLCGSFSPKRSSVKGNLGLIKDDSEKIESEEVPASQLEWSQKLSHHEKYNKFIRGKSSDQYSEKDESVVYDNSTSLLAPEPTFAVEKEALTLKTDTFLYRKQKMIFENFKGKCEPSTEGRPWEKGWDDAALPPKELNEIYASSAVIDFGKITNHTTNRLPLNFLNASSLPIKICLDPIRGGKNCPETSFISVDVKILRLHTLDISGTEICFQANQTGEFAGSVRYIINNSYAYDIFVKAQVLPVDLVCSTDTVAIKYVAQGIQDGPKADPSPNFIIRKVIGIDYKFPTSSSQFKIANEGKFEASFEIIGSKTDGADILGLDLINGGDSDGWFTISPQNGLVTPGEFVNVTVTYIPGTKMNLKRIYNISVVDSFGVPSVVKKITITVIGSCDTSDVQLLNTNLRQGALDLGALPVITRDDCGDLYTMQTEYSKDNIGKFALTGTKSLKLKSKGENPCNFIASTPGAEKGFTVFPTFGTILPGQSVEIKVQAMAYSPAIIEDFVIVNVIGGGKGFKIPVRYEGKFPNIEIVKLESPFSENVVIGSSSSESLSVINKGQVLGRCIFDLSKFSDFSVKLVDEKSGAGNARKSAIGGDLLGLARKNKLGFLASRNIYALDIAPGDKLSLDLVFKPNVPVVYEEQIIPVYMLGARLAWTFELPIRTRATISPLKLVTSDIVFKDLILQSDATGILSAMHHKLEIENISDEPQTWAASVSCSGSYALKSFSVDAEQGLLKPGEVTSVKISFHPSKTGNYSGIIDIYLKVLGQDVSIPVSLRGNAIAPSLTFDPVELFLPVVPLHTISRAKFWIINNGCELSIKVLI